VDPARAVGAIVEPSGGGRAPVGGIAAIPQPVPEGRGLILAAGSIGAAGVLLVFGVLLGGSVARRRRA